MGVIANNSAARPLEISNLTKRYDQFVALDSVTFHMEPGEVFGLIGPNGAGKTSLIQILTTLNTPSSGTAKVFGIDVTSAGRQSKPLIGYVPQETVSHGFFNVEEVLQFHSGYYGISNNKKQIDFLLERLSLADHRTKRVRQLSGGMKRRLLIAKALVHKPRLLLLDEPTAGVDIELRTSLWAFVRELNKEGVAVLLTTHYLEEAESLCGRVGLIHKGKLIKIDKTQNLVQSLTSREIHLRVSGDLGSIQHPLLASRDGEDLIFRVPNQVVVGDLIREIKLAPERLLDVHVREGKLEDAFVHLLREVK
jgi:ABC-2 type transport system ATP-binding protein